MKIWVEFSYSWLFNEESLWFGVVGYRHAWKEYKGFTVHLNLFKWLVVINLVDDYKMYRKIIDNRRSIMSKLFKKDN